MADPKHLEILNRGVDVWNEWRENNPDIRPDLKEANFFKTTLSGANFFNTILSRAEFHIANLH